MVNASPPASPGTDPPTGSARTMRKIEAVVAFCTRTFLFAASFILIVILVLITYSVVWRYFLNAPQPWVDEAAGWLLVGAVMLALPEVQRRNDHIGIDVLHQKFGGRPAARWLLILGVLTVLLSSLIIIIEGYGMVQFSRMVGIVSNQIPEVHIWVVQLLVPVGFGLMALVAAVQLLCLCLGITPTAMNTTPHGDLK